MRGYQRADRTSPVMSTARQPMPGGPLWRVRLARAVLKAEQFGPPTQWFHSSAVRHEVAGLAPDQTKAGCRAIVCRIAEEHGVTFAEIRGPRRQKPILAARKAAVIAVAKHMPQWSMSQIGQFFNRDPTTIMHALGLLRRGGAA
jgi:chromosomal replication initiation ATPase DnaA